MTQFAQIPTELICRFGELSKTEIRVVGYLYATRNRKTGQCNPSRARIARETGVAAPHVSKATKSLEDKGWIFEDAQGNFLLFDAPDEVTESVIKDDGIGNNEMTESVTNVTESVTESDGIGHFTPYSSFEQSIEQKNEQREAPEPRELFLGRGLIPDTEELVGYSIDLFTQDRISEVVTDFVPEWLQLVKNRMVGLQGAHRNHIQTKIGYWLDDYQRNLWRFRKDRENQNATTKPTSEREKSASRQVAGYSIADQLEREARAEMEAIRSLNDAGRPENRQLGERSSFDGNGIGFEGQGLV